MHIESPLHLVFLSGVLAVKDLCKWRGVHRSFALVRMTRFFRESMLAIHEHEDGVSFAIKVHPRAKKNAVTGGLGDALKVSLTAPPVEGRANEACIEF